MLNQKILSIDEDPDLVEEIAFRVENFGFECLTSTSLYEALDYAEVEKPDLILFTLNFAENFGADFFKRIHMSYKEGDNLPPVIILNDSEALNLEEYAHDMGLVPLLKLNYSNFTSIKSSSDWLPFDEYIVVS